MLIVNPIVEAYIQARMKSDPPLLKELVLETHESMEAPQMICGPVVGGLLALLVNLSKAKRIIEIGMFTGYSTLQMASSLIAEGKIITTEINPKAISIAQKYFNKSPWRNKIEIMEGKALDTLQKLPGPFDFAFIDADKENYINYYQALLPHITKGGFIVIDNALREGRVIEAKDNVGKIIDKLNQLIAEDPNVENILFSVRDGVNVVRKL